MKVLVAVDGSTESFDAVRMTGWLLSPEKDEVALYYSPPEIQLRSPTPVAPDVQDRARQALAAAVFSEARAQLPDALGTSAHTIVGTQRADHGVTVAADQWRADLVVLGAHGSGPLKKVLLGSVSKAVAHTATTPVLIVRPNPKYQPHSGLNVLLATDGSDVGDQAANFLGHFHWPKGTTGRTLLVMESFFAGTVPDWLEKKARDEDAEAMAKAWVREHDVEKAAKRQELLALASRLPAPFHNQEPLVREGVPPQEILRVVDEEKIDLLVVGARGLRPVSKFFLGSTSDKVLSHAPCSVLVVRRHEKP